jgi:cytidine deaminase
MQYIDIDTDDKKLIDEAIAVIKRNYAEPRHTVGAAVLCASGKIYTGVNIESCGYGPCAEPIAIGAAISQGEREIVSIVGVVVRGNSFPVESPCGNRRQLLFDYAPDCMVIIPHGDRVVKVRARELIPDAFSNF